MRACVLTASAPREFGPTTAAGTLTVFLPAATSERALANLDDNGRIAVTVHPRHRPPFAAD